MTRVVSTYEQPLFRKERISSPECVIARFCLARPHPMADTTRSPLPRHPEYTSPARPPSADGARGTPFTAHGRTACRPRAVVASWALLRCHCCSAESALCFASSVLASLGWWPSHGSRPRRSCLRSVGTCAELSAVELVAVRSECLCHMLSRDLQRAKSLFITVLSERHR